MPVLLCVYDCTNGEYQSCDILLHASWTCWYNAARVLGGLTEWLVCCSIMSHTSSMGMSLVIVLAREIVKHLAEYVELHVCHMGGNSPTGTVYHIPSAGIAEYVE